MQCSAVTAIPPRGKEDEPEAAEKPPVAEKPAEKPAAKPPSIQVECSESIRPYHSSLICDVKAYVASVPAQPVAQQPSPQPVAVVAAPVCTIIQVPVLKLSFTQAAAAIQAATERPAIQQTTAAAEATDASKAV